MASGPCTFVKWIAPLGVHDRGSISGFGMEDGNSAKGRFIELDKALVLCQIRLEVGGAGSPSLLNTPIDDSAANPVALPSLFKAPAPSAPPVGSKWGNIFETG
jgi:hypothetical protein